MMTSCNLKPGTNKLSEAEIIGDRKNYKVTLSPSTVRTTEGTSFTASQGRVFGSEQR